MKRASEKDPTPYLYKTASTTPMRALQYPPALTPASKLARTIPEHALCF
jgi:hypothetical protein